MKCNIVYAIIRICSRKVVLEIMNIPTTLVLSLIAALLATVGKKYYTDNSSGSLSGGFIFNAVCSLAAAVVLLLWGGFGYMSVFTIIFGIAFGAVTALQGITNIAALQTGPMSYTTVIMSFSTLISALSGVMESAVFFPIVNGGGLVLTTLAAVAVFREKLTQKTMDRCCCGYSFGRISVQSFGSIKLFRSEEVLCSFSR